MTLPGQSANDTSTAISNRSSAHRDSNIDLLRAVAILMVLAYHIHGMWPHQLPCGQLAKLGAYGVELFFVISGWLIGGLYWREEQTLGFVRIMHFWKRRWLRTIPPYAVALCVSWAAVFLARREPFDPAYLAFLQNYRSEIPFFLISWSLCVEEHFYLILPILVCAARRLRVSPVIFLIPFAIGPVLYRSAGGQVPDYTSFGYDVTATHLRTEGIACGALMAWIATKSPGLWTALGRWCRYLLIPALALFVSTSWWSRPAVYYIGLTVVPVSAAVCLCAVAGQRSILSSRSRTVRFVAGTSYSVYLTHSLAIHAARSGSRYVDFGGDVILLIVWLAIIFGTGALFHAAVEATSLRLRESIAPRLLNADGDVRKDEGKT